MTQRGWTVVTHFDAPREVGAVTQFRVFFDSRNDAFERAETICSDGLTMELDESGSALDVPPHRIRAVEVWVGDHTKYPTLETDLRMASKRLGDYIDNNRG
jgi:hypothetical protein